MTLFQVLQISILTRFLPKEAFGLVAMTLFVVNLTNIFVDMGLNAAILHRNNATQKEYSSIYWLNLFFAVVFYGLLSVLAPFFADFYHESQLKNLIPLLGINILLIALGRQHFSQLQKQMRFKIIAQIELTAFLIGLAIAVVMAISGEGVYSLVYSTLAVSAITNVSFLIVNVRRFPLKFYFSLAHSMPYVKVGAYNMGSNIMDFVSRETDILIIGRIMGAETLGLYSLAKQLVFKLYGILNNIAINVLNPMMAGVQNNALKMHEYAYRSMRLIASVTIPVNLIIILLAREILHILYGSSYVIGSWIVVFLSLSLVCQAITNPAGSLQIATGQTNIGFKWSVFKAIISATIILLLAPFGINVLSLGIGVIGVLFLIPMWYMQFKKMISMKLVTYLNAFKSPLIAFLMVVFLNVIVLHFNDMQMIVWWETGIRLLAGVIVFMAVWMVIDRAGIKELLSVVKSSGK